MVVKDWPRAMMLMRVEAANSWATPSETAVRSPMATTTSTRLKPRSLELHFACAIDRHRLGLAVAGNRDRHRLRNRLRHAGHNRIGGAVRAELDVRARDGHPVEKGMDRAVEVGP